VSGQLASAQTALKEAQLRVADLEMQLAHKEGQIREMSQSGSELTREPAAPERMRNLPSDEQHRKLRKLRNQYDAMTCYMTRYEAS